MSAAALATDPAGSRRGRIWDTPDLRDRFQRYSRELRTHGLPPSAGSRGAQVSGLLHGLDDSAVRFLEVHETRAHAVGGRIFRDLGDCVALNAPGDREPWFNRVAAVRWPDGASAFDGRLAEIMSLFAGMDRRPHVWTAPAFNTPADLVARLTRFGFRDQGGGYTMLLVRHPPPPLAPMPPGVAVECLDGGPGVFVPPRAVGEIGRVLAESFAADPEQAGAITAETADAFASPWFHVSVVRVDGEPVAVGKRYTFDGASYLSSIGTKRGSRGRGYGSLVTRALIRDSLAAGSDFVYLGVHTHNDEAISLYRRAGMEIVGDVGCDLLLE